MNKKLLDIAGLVAFILGIIECCTIFGAIVGIPCIIGGLKLREYAQMSDEDLRKNKDSVLIWGIVFVFICTVVGVLTIVFYVFYIDDNNIMGKKTDKYDELEKLNQLYKEKAITKEEYEKEKEKILNK